MSQKHEMKKSVKITLGALLILIIVGAAVQFDKYTKRKNGLLLPMANTEQNVSQIEGTLLKLGGSSTIGDELAPALIKGFLEKNGYSDIQILNTGKDEKIVVGTKDNKKEKIQVFSKGTGKGFAALNDNTIDICMASAKAPTGSSYEEHPIGLDGIAIVVNKASALQNINYLDIKNIFSNNNTKVLRMDDNAGISKVFKEAVMGDKIINTSAQLFAKSTDLITALSSDQSAISFCSYTLLNKGNIRALPISIEANMPGIIPNVLTIQSEKYPLCRRLYLYTNKSTNILTSKFIDYVESKEGQNIVNDIGFVNLNITINNNEQNPIALPNDPPEYTKLEKTGIKITSELRFEFGKQNLDSRGVSDVLRLTDYISQPENRNKKIILVGFTDNSGNLKTNIDLSLRRANTVKIILSASGLNITKVMGFGSARPVRSNDTEQDRADNRRVEVWLIN